MQTANPSKGLVISYQFSEFFFFTLFYFSFFLIKLSKLLRTECLLTDHCSALENVYRTRNYFRMELKITTGLGDNFWETAVHVQVLYLFMIVNSTNSHFCKSVKYPWILSFLSRIRKQKLEIFCDLFQLGVLDYFVMESRSDRSRSERVERRYIA